MDSKRLYEKKRMSAAGHNPEALCQENGMNYQTRTRKLMWARQ